MEERISERIGKTANLLSPATPSAIKENAAAAAFQSGNSPLTQPFHFPQTFIDFTEVRQEIEIETERTTGNNKVLFF